MVTPNNFPNDGFLGILRSRRSIRKFLPRPISEDVVLALIELGTSAPSAGNRQDWFFTAVRNASLKAAIAVAVEEKWAALNSRIAETNADLAQEMHTYSGNFSWFKDAPLLLIVSGRRPLSFEKEYFGAQASLVSGSRASAAMAAQNVLLGAHAMGLGGCCLTGPLVASDEVASLIGLSKRHEIVCLLALGYPDEHNAPPPKKDPRTIMKLL